MQITPQRRIELSMMLEAIGGSWSECDVNRESPRADELWDRLDVRMKALANALREVGYNRDADFLEHELLLPVAERCDLWDSLESMAMDFDDITGLDD